MLFLEVFYICLFIQLLQDDKALKMRAELSRQKRLTAMAEEQRPQLLKPLQNEETPSTSKESEDMFGR